MPMLKVSPYWCAGGGEKACSGGGVCGEGGGQGEGGQESNWQSGHLRLSRNILNMHLRAIPDICHFLGLNISHSNDTLNKEQNSTRSFGFFKT